jgi:hypothetical protein
VLFNKVAFKNNTNFGQSDCNTLKTKIWLQHEVIKFCCPANHLLHSLTHGILKIQSSPTVGHFLSLRGTSAVMDVLCNVALLCVRRKLFVGGLSWETTQGNIFDDDTGAS